MKKTTEYRLDERSTEETFKEYLRACGNDLMKFYDDVLVFINFHDRPEKIDDFLEEEGFYSGVNLDNYTPPSKTYIDWFREKFK